MTVLKNRISKLEQQAGIRETMPPIFVDVVRWIAGGPVAMSEQVGLYSESKQGSLLLRLPGESVDALHDRARREHPNTRIWVTAYGGDVSFRK